jgi:ATP-dependent Clp protease adapter protein ClpS
MTDTDVAIAEKTQIDTSIQLPPLYCVIYHNDDATPLLFVAYSLMDIFGYTSDDAISMSEYIHTAEIGVVASDLSYELATHLRDLALYAARKENYPLQVDVKENT